VTGVVFLFGTLAVALWLARKFLRDTAPPPVRPKCHHPRWERCRDCHEVVR
jgi:hypothetical protein